MPETLAVKLLDWREPSYMNTRSVGILASMASASTACLTSPSGTGVYSLNMG